MLETSSGTTSYAVSEPPPSKREPGEAERAFLRQHRLVYHRPELFPDDALRVAREAVRQGFRHPMADFFAWLT
jgi:hypothetical protein